MTQTRDTSHVSTMQRVNGALASLSAAVLPSVVEVRNHGRGAGAGTIWHADGLIATNAHVVSQRGRGHRSANRGGLSVRLSDGSEHQARVLAQHDALDIAFLRIDLDGRDVEEREVTLPTIPLGDSRALAAGDMVVAFGHPWGVRGAATSGIVIGMGDRLPELAESGREWLAASLHLRPGHSGGPMVDSRGRLVGINTLMNGPDVGVAVPVHVAKRFLQEAYNRGRASQQGAPVYV